MVRTIVLITPVLLAFPFPGISQNAASVPSGVAGPKFAVSSVKECTSKEDLAHGSMTSPGTLSLACSNLQMLIQLAYDVFASGKSDTSNAGIPTMKMEGLPNWANSTLYSINARTDSPQSAAMMRGPMMQALLEERFDLKVHREKRDGPAYLMTLVQGPLKLRETREGTCVPFDFSEALNTSPTDLPLCGVPNINRRGPATVVDVRGITLGMWSKSLHPDGLPVIDQTGLEGTYDIHLEWGSDAPAPPPADTGAASDPSPHSTTIVAMREQLGLKLTRGRGTTEFLIIDHIEKPREN